MAEHFILNRDQDKNINLRSFLKFIEFNRDAMKIAYPSHSLDNTQLNNLDKRRSMLIALKQFAAVHKRKNAECSSSDNATNKNMM